jgi:hypothetical protein
MRVSGFGTAAVWLPECPDVRLVQGFDQVVDYRPDDLVVRVGSRVRLDDLAALLENDGLCLPILRNRGWLGYPGETVGGLVGLGLPHFHQESVGAIRDWVIGMKIRLASGEIVTSGAGVVKSVAGFDLHRMMVGSRGSLAEILEIGLRLSPIALKPREQELPSFDGPTWIHRVPKGFVANHGIMDSSGRWIWSDRKLYVPPSGWGLGPGGVRFGAVDPTAKRYRQNLKNALDPNGVWKEGWKQ